MLGWTIIVAIILGIVEGLTEFAPVSSTGHMIIVDDMYLHSDQLMNEHVAIAFKIFVQLGSILAVVVVFWKRLLSLIGLYKLENDEGDNSHFSLIHLIIGILPAAILGLLFQDLIDEYLFGVQPVIWALIVGGIFMIIADKWKVKTTAHTLDQLTYKQAFGIGLIQCFSLWPGFSRSGATISGGLLLGASHRTASEFSFIMAIPIMFGASLLTAIDKWQYITVDVLPFMAAGFITAFISALICIKFFLNLINKVKLTPFAIYRFIVAAILIWLTW